MTAPAVILAAFLAADLLAPFLDPASVEGRRGKAAYERGGWDEAAEHFAKSLQAKPDAVGEFNAGTAAFRQGRFEEAAEVFGRAAGSAEGPQEEAMYNLGNARFESGDLAGALGAFRAALRENPNDEDARTNYEITLRRQSEGPPPRERRPNPSQNSGNENAGQGENASQDSSQASSNPDEKPGESGKEPSSEEQKPKPQGSEASAEEGKEPQEGEPAGTKQKAQLLSAEEARRLLDAVTPEERELLQARLKANRRKKAEKDW